MKTILTLLSLTFFMTLNAQENEEKNDKSRFDKWRIDDGTETLANRKGGFGAFLELNTMPTFINNQPGMMTGGGLSLVFGHSLNLGVAGYGLITNVQSNTFDTTGNYYNLQTGYGGITIEPVFFSKKLVHISFPVLLGMGATSLSHFDLYDSQTYEANWSDPDYYYIVRPGMNIEINLLRILRLDLGFNYRFTTGYNFNNTNPGNLNGWSGNIGLKLGWF